MLAGSQSYVIRAQYNVKLKHLSRHKYTSFDTSPVKPLTLVLEQFMGLPWTTLVKNYM